MTVLDIIQLKHTNQILRAQNERTERVYLATATKYAALLQAFNALEQESKALAQENDRLRTVSDSQGGTR